ncbi:MAG: methyl-accepting chemotaxis protein [Methylovulum sp.]
MRVNLPVTQVEQFFAANEILVSETNSSSVIKTANAAFCKIAGFAEEELVGKTHNVVRHPDMPVEAFADMWRTIKAGKQWYGMVKNRCENGDYYWVKATVTPVYEGSNLLGYRSVRKQPTRDEVMAAERLYQRIKNGEKITLDTLAERRQAAGMLGRFSLMLRWWMPQVLSALGLASVAFMAVSEVNQDILIASTGVAIVVPLLLTAWAGAQTTKVLQKIQQGMQRFDSGEIAARIDYYGEDELGKISQLFNRNADMVETSLGDISQTVSAMAVGDFSRRVVATMNGDFDTVKTSVNSSVESIKITMNALNELMAALSSGSFDCAVNVNVSGDYKLAVDNSLLAMRSLQLMIDEVGKVMNAVAQGDLTQRVFTEGQGDLSKLKDNINVSLEGLVQAMRIINDNTRQVASAANQSSSAIGQISDGAQNQMHAISQVATAVRQTATSVTDVANNTEAASKNSQESVGIVRDGKLKMERMVDVVNSIAVNSEKINKITEVIEKIANKTNLLSLNAAIEAARAGEHGRGFAVVAEEVGKLAASSAESTQEIAYLVQQAVTDANRAVASVREVSVDMDKIEQGAVQTEGMLQRISAALEEQSSAVHEINANVVNLNKIAENNAAASEQITATVIELSRIADTTRKAVDKFSV